MSELPSHQEYATKQGSENIGLVRTVNTHRYDALACARHQRDAYFSREFGNILRRFGVSMSMNPSRFSAEMLRAFAAALAGLFLMLTLCAAVVSKPTAHGVRFYLMRQSSSDYYCGDSRTEVIHWKDGSVWLNEENVGLEQAPWRVAEVMENRVERVIFIVPGENTSIQDVADLTARLESSVDDLHVGLLTDRQIKSMTRTDHGMTWVRIDCMTLPRLAVPLK